MHELYQGQLLQLAKLARQTNALSLPSHRAVLNNPICGDTVTIEATVHDEQITDIHLIVRGCALCEAGAGAWSKAAIGKSTDYLKNLSYEMSAYLQHENPAPNENVTCFEPVKNIKNRIKCVLLAFEAGEKLTPILPD